MVLSIEHVDSIYSAMQRTRINIAIVLKMRMCMLQMEKINLIM